MTAIGLPQLRAVDLRHDSAHTMSLGCLPCKSLDLCGGFKVAKRLFSCRSLCKCQDRDRCQFVCPHRPMAFVRSLQEVDGLAFDNIPRAAPIELPRLPAVVPMVYGPSCRTGSVVADAVAIPLGALFDRRTGTTRFVSRNALCQHFRIAPTAKLVVSGVDIDRTLERFWSLGRAAGIIPSLATLGLDLVTTPNYSLFLDAPREDNLHNMKRIAIVWQEMAAAGIPAALHVNARTDRDWERWTEFVAARPEVAAIAFEFGTGASSPQRGRWHVDQLCRLQTDVKRPLQLIVRGSQFVPILAVTFREVISVDTAVFVKTMKRYRAEAGGERHTWRKTFTFTDEPLDLLFQHNVDIATRRVNAAEDANRDRLAADGAVSLTSVGGNRSVDLE